MRFTTIATLLFSVGCLPVQGRIVQEPLPNKNPTTYEFSVALSEMRQVIKSAFGMGGYRGMVLVFREDESPFASPLLSESGNENDALLHSFHTPIGKSSMYFSQSGDPLDYLAQFHLHLEAIGPQSTRVSVHTIQPEIVIGKTSGFLNPHGPANIYRPVEPTTVEEYEILLKIGATLGAKNMPPLRIPTH